MPERAAPVPYTPYPTEQASGNLGGGMSVRANPNDFGAQVSEATENLGNKSFEVAQKFQGLINETQQNNAEADFMKAAGDLKAKYSQYEGLQAEAMRPQYETELTQLQNQFRQSLPPIVQKGFDATTLHQMAYQTNEYSQYAAGQVKQANVNSQQAVGNAAVSTAGNLNVALDDNQLKWQADTIRHTGNALADIHGDSILATGQDDGKGNYSYPDTPEGKAAQARHMAYTNEKLTQLYMTAGKTVTDNQGASAGAEWFQKHWDDLPDSAKVQANQYLAPKIKNETMGSIVDGTISGAEQAYTQKIATGENIKSPLDVIRQNEGIGYSKDSKGEVINGINSLAYPQQFAEAKHILDTQGQAAANKYADNFYQKNIIDKYDIGSLPPATQAIVADGLVNHGTGAFGQSLVAAAKNGATPQQLIDMRRAEYQRLNDTGQSQYTSAFKGWNNRLDALQRNIPNGLQPPQELQSRGDFFKENEENLVQSARDEYLNKYPGDEWGAMGIANRTRTQVNRFISMERQQLNNNIDIVQKTIEGGFNGERKPTSLDEVGLFNPQAKQALEALEQGQPRIVRSFEKQFAANAKDEKSKGYGDGFLPTLNRIVSDDPIDTIKDSKDLTEEYGANPNLYLRGYTQASKLVQQAQTPEGKAILARQAQFLSSLHDKMVAGENDTQGKAQFNKALPLFFIQYDTLSKDGKEGSLLNFDEKNPFLQGLNLPTSAQLTSKKIDNSVSIISKMLGGYANPTTFGSEQHAQQNTQIPNTLKVPRPE